MKDMEEEEAVMLFQPGQVNMKILIQRLNWLDRSANSDGKKYKAMAALIASACGYDALCAGVNKSIGNAFKEEAEADTVPWQTPFPGAIHDPPKE